VHDKRELGQAALDFFQHVEVQRLAALEFKGTVARADGAGERVAAGLLYKLLGFGGIGEAGVPFLDLDVFLDSTKHAELGFDGEALGVGAFDDALGDGDVFLERIVRGVDHDRAKEARVDAVVASLLVTVVEVHGENRFGVNLGCAADDCFEHPLVGVFACALRDLNDERGLGVDCALEQPHRLLRVVNVIRADSVFTVGVLKELCGRYDHGAGRQPDLPQTDKAIVGGATIRVAALLRGSRRGDR